MFPLLNRIVKGLPAFCNNTYGVNLCRAVFVLIFYRFHRVGNFHTESAIFPINGPPLYS